LRGTGRSHQGVKAKGCRPLKHRRKPTKPRPAPTPPPPPPIFGFNSYISPQTVAMQRQVGAATTRLIIDWSSVESFPGQWNWQLSDQRYQQILAGGLRPLIVAFNAPCWATATGHCNAVTISPPGPAHDSDWAQFVSRLASRYPQAVAIEVWSEQNLAGDFYPAPDPVRYTQMLKLAYGAVKAAVPTMPVISGGLLLDDGTGSGAGGEASRTFLAGMYGAGAENYMDGLGLHIYPSDPQSGSSPMTWDPAAMTRWLAQVAQVTSAAAVPLKPLWVTEMGVSTSTQPGFPQKLTPQQQAQDMSALLAQAAADHRIRAVLIHTLQDADPNLPLDLLTNLGGLFSDDIFFNQINEGFGIFTNRWVRKPAACVVSRAFGGSLNC
jgi:hypothetical protein